MSKNADLVIADNITEFIQDEFAEILFHELVDLFKKLSLKQFKIDYNSYSYTFSREELASAKYLVSVNGTPTESLVDVTLKTPGGKQIRVMCEKDLKTGKITIK